MANLYCLETYMDLKKLIFFGRLCRLCKYGFAKSEFLERLYQYHYVTSTFKCQLGFLPDVMRVISKYNLCHYVSEYVNPCVFPSKTLWRSIVHDAVRPFVNPDLILNLINNFENENEDALIYGIPVYEALKK